MSKTLCESNEQSSFFSTNPVRIKAAIFCVMNVSSHFDEVKTSFLSLSETWRRFKLANAILLRLKFLFLWPLPIHVCWKFWKWKLVNFIIFDILIRTCFIRHIFLFNLKKFRNQIPRINSKMELSRDILKPVELWWKIMVLLTCFAVGVPLVGNFLELD